VRDIASVCGVGVCGAWLWPDLKSYIDRELCILVTMSRMGYITIYLDGKCRIKYLVG
jgi:hypothetical protein